MFKFARRTASEEPAGTSATPQSSSSLPWGGLKKYKPAVKGWFDSPTQTTQQATIAARPESSLTAKINDTIARLNRNPKYEEATPSLFPVIQGSQTPFSADYARQTTPNKPPFFSPSSSGQPALYTPLTSSSSTPGSNGRTGFTPFFGTSASTSDEPFFSPPPKPSRNFGLKW